MAGPNAAKVDIPTTWDIYPVISVCHPTKAEASPDLYRRGSLKSTVVAVDESLVP